MAQIPVTSQEIRTLPVAAVKWQEGQQVLVDLTDDQVDVALIPPDQSPAEADWVSCSWSTDRPGTVQLLLNLGGWDLPTLLGDLDQQFFYPWVRVHDDPETPVVRGPDTLRVFT